ncbi:hypothetical protein EDC40_101528 [Aminobacter aminovorans]|jgi:hypothetical protein|uniref:Secreted protein n=1 Tax=Aminobacter aminovorans TaxID=83263 RepID=A0A380WQ35_AMIAI|nr:hypothetical protein [Aminobacter aminovorans]TCS30210.1 hypothetical protein EDC40_101528 [Aminobacter aminovorans]SUU91059.1 Uncharacterised protein [Aminobacter aminovorans]
MKTLRSMFRPAMTAVCALGLFATSVAAAPVRSAEGEILVAAADCYSVGQQVADQHGGTLARASESNQGGQSVCVIVVLVPAKDGQRPRRVEVVVPAN